MRHNPEALMLFAAGFGTRMGTLTAARPKPLLTVAGRALIDHALDQSDGIRVARKVVNLHYLSDQIAAHLSHREDIELSVEVPDILETGGGLKQALPLLGPGPVFTLNTDAVWTGGNPLAELQAAWDGAAMDALLLVVPSGSARGHAGAGDFSFDAEGRIARGHDFVYVGAQILKTQGLAQISDRVFSLNRLWDRMIADRRAFGLVHQGGWCDVSRAEAIPEAEAMLRDATHV